MARIFAVALLLLIGAHAVAQSDAPWRSSLYPDAWTPAHTDAKGRFLHDFSYAGYRRGEHPIPDLTKRKRADIDLSKAGPRSGISQKAGQTPGVVGIFMRASK